MPLPISWVNRIFEKLTLLYGHDFLNRWRDLDIDAVKVDWAHELGGFESHPEAIAHALNCLPSGKPPTVLEFREIARKCPLPVFKALPRPESSPDQREKIKEMLDEARKRMGVRAA